MYDVAFFFFSNLLPMTTWSK